LRGFVFQIGVRRKCLKGAIEKQNRTASGSAGYVFAGGIVKGSALANPAIKPESKSAKDHHHVILQIC
jgi:hypothetical protein